MWFVDQIYESHVVYIKDKFASQQKMFKLMQNINIVKVFFSIVV